MRYVTKIFDGVEQIEGSIVELGGDLVDGLEHGSHGRIGQG